jgi:hypothetical protein
MLQRGQLSLAAFPNDGQYWGRQRAERRLLSSRLSERGRPMLATIVLGAAAGALLGSHCKMFILGPAILLACFATVAAGFTSHFDAHTIVLGVLATLAALQFGYVVGGVVAAYLDAKAERPHRTWTPSQYY